MHLPRPGALPESLPPGSLQRQGQHRLRARERFTDLDPSRGPWGEERERCHRRVRGTERSAGRRGTRHRGGLRPGHLRGQRRVLASEPATGRVLRPGVRTDAAEFARPPCVWPHDHDDGAVPDRARPVRAERHASRGRGGADLPSVRPVGPRPRESVFGGQLRLHCLRVGDDHGHPGRGGRQPEPEADTRRLDRYLPIGSRDHRGEHHGGCDRIPTDPLRRDAHQAGVPSTAETATSRSR